ncbi:MAG: asparaginase domain-containing protein [Bacteroidales bacterium]|nr:asparaginase domain-containing protein [Bacteroidales bacterium]
MRRLLILMYLVCLPLCCSAALPKIHIIATGGTIAGRTASDGKGYDAGQVGIDVLLDAVPRLKKYAELDYEQFCNIGSQDMDENVWMALSRLVNEVLSGDVYDAVIITHGTDTMEETAFFLNLTVRGPKPVILVGAMRPSDAPDADGPANLLAAVKATASRRCQGREVLCCSAGKLYEAGRIFKYDSHAIEAFCSGNGLSGLRRGMFDISSVGVLPKVGIIYGYAGCSTLPLRAFIDNGFDGVVLAGVGMGNFYGEVMDLALKAAAGGMKIVRSTRVVSGGVFTPLGEVNDEQCGFIAAGPLNPQKARILLMLALTRTDDTAAIRNYFAK